MDVLAKIEHWKTQLDEVTAEVQNLFGQIGIDVLNQRPEKGRWSVAENLDHLVRVNESYFPIFERVRTGLYKTPFLGKVGWISRFMGNATLAGSGPPEGNRELRGLRTFKMWEPRNRDLFPNPVGEFVDMQSALKHQVAACDTVLVRNPVIASPASPVLVYPLSQAFDFIIAHERRHVEQARAALETVVRGRSGV